MTRQRRAGWLARTAVIAIAVAMLATGCGVSEDTGPTGSSFQFVSPGGQVDISYELPDRQAVPNIAGEDLMREGEQLSAAQYAGKVVVVNIWGQWCPPCRSEALELEKLYQQTKEAGVQVLGIDVRDDDRQAPQDFMRNRGLTYPSIYDPPGRTLLQLSGYPRNAVPSTIVLDKHQRVAAVFLRDLLASDLRPVVDRLLAEP